MAMDDKQDEKRSWRRFWLLILLGFAAGCGPRRTPEETRVLEIARQAVAANDKWADQAEFGSPVRDRSGYWTILARRRPRTIGGDRLIFIDEKGKVTGYFRGH